MDNSMLRAEAVKQQAAIGEFAHGAIVGGQKIMKEQPRNQEIPEKMGNLFHKIGQLNAVANNLVDRLSPVMRPPSPGKETGQAEAPSHTNMGNQLTEVINQMRSILDVLDSAADRLEL